jgi:hypothetical protein
MRRTPGRTIGRFRRDTPTIVAVGDAGSHGPKVVILVARRTVRTDRRIRVIRLIPVERDRNTIRHASCGSRLARVCRRDRGMRALARRQEV